MTQKNFGALTADARMLLDPGEKYVVSDSTGQIESILPSAKLEPWYVPTLRRNGIRFVVADQRVVASDGTRGYYFSLKDSPRDALLPRTAITKFEGVPGVAKIFDSGSILVYDLDAYNVAASGSS